MSCHATPARNERRCVAGALILSLPSTTSAFAFCAGAVPGTNGTASVVPAGTCLRRLRRAGQGRRATSAAGAQASPAAFFTSVMNACSASLTRTPPKPRKPPSFDASAAFCATPTSIAL